MEPSELLEQTEGADGKLGNYVAVSVAILAVMMGIFKVKDDNICQAMQQAQADRIDNWGWYQAKKTRADVNENTVRILESMPNPNAKAIAEAKADVEKQRKESDDVQAKAKQAEKDYDALNFRDDQFDMSDSALTASIALLAITALTKKKWLFYVAIIPMLFGLLMGIAGMFGLGIHPDALAKFLGT